MKYILIVLLLIGHGANAQRPIYVHSKKDKRLKMYMDSLKVYNDNIKWKEYAISELSKCITLDQYAKCVKKLGFDGDVTPVINNGKEVNRYVNDTKGTLDKRGFVYECIFVGRFRSGTVWPLYNILLPKPRQPYIFKPIVIVEKETKKVDSNLKIIYMVEKTNGAIRIDSTKNKTFTKYIVSH